MAGSAVRIGCLDRQWDKPFQYLLVLSRAWRSVLRLPTPRRRSRRAHGDSDNLVYFFLGRFGDGGSVHPSRSWGALSSRPPASLAHSFANGSTPRCSVVAGCADTQLPCGMRQLSSDFHGTVISLLKPKKSCFLREIHRKNAR